LFNEKTGYSILYLLLLGEIGAFILSITAFLGPLAALCNSTATNMGSVFLPYGLGAMIGSLGSVSLYKNHSGNVILGGTILTTACMAVLLPFNTSAIQMHVMYFLQGVCVSMIETGCYHLLSRIQGDSERSGQFWLLMGQFGFNFGGALLICIAKEAFSMTFEATFLLIAALMTLSAGVLFLILPAERLFSESTSAHEDPNKNNREQELALMSAMEDASTETDIETSQQETVMNTASHRNTEIVTSLVIFCLVGGMMMLTSFLYSYAEDTSYESTAVAQRQAYTLWFSMSLGTLGYMIARNFEVLSDVNLFYALLVSIAFAALVMFAVFAFSDSLVFIWIGVIVYGFAGRFALCLCDGWMKFAATSLVESSLCRSISQAGFHLGATIVPFISALLWNYWLGPEILFSSVLLFTLLALPLSLISAIVSPRDEFKTWRQYGITGCSCVLFTHEIDASHRE
jgi:predicted MFS family arabinose efflux permease